MCQQQGEIFPATDLEFGAKKRMLEGSFVIFYRILALLKVVTQKRLCLLNNLQTTFFKILFKSCLQLFVIKRHHIVIYTHIGYLTGVTN